MSTTPAPVTHRRRTRALLGSVTAAALVVAGVTDAGAADAVPTMSRIAAAPVPAPAGWSVVDTATVPSTHTVTVALVAPQGTVPSFTTDNARAAVDVAASYYSRETDGRLTLAVAKVEDWRQMTDSTPCSWTGTLQDWVSPQIGWTRGENQHLVVMVPPGEPCPAWANGEQGDRVSAGGRSFQPGYDAGTLIHELGHNMSLPHAASIQCVGAWDFSTIGAGIPQGCNRSEYGSQLDVMGGSWWLLAPFASPTLSRLGMLPRRFEPQCGATRQLTVNATGQGAGKRTAISWVDPADSGARYWVDFRAVADAQKYKDLMNLPWGFAPTRAGLQILRTDPDLSFGSVVLERPGDTGSMRQLTAIDERVSLHGGATVVLRSVAADGASGVVDLFVPCAGGSTTPDTVAPVVTVTTSPAAPNAAGWYTSAVGVTAVATDDSGVTPTLQISRDGGTTFVDYTLPLQLTDGSTAVRVRATDAAGNVTLVDRALKVDTVEPTVTATTDAVARTVTVTGADPAPGSGVAAVEHRTNGSAWVRVAGSRSVVAVGPAAGVVDYRAVDVAGNVGATGTTTIPAVAAPPVKATTTVTSAGPVVAGWYTTSATVSIATPAGTQGRYRVDGGEWRVVAGRFAIYYSGTHTIDTELLRDGAPVAGSGDSTTVRIDRQPPSTRATKAPNTNTGTPRNPIVLTFTGSDAHSGVARTEYQVDQGTWAAVGVGQAVTIATVGTHAVGYRSIDAAGNVAATRTVTVDITPDIPTSVTAGVTSVKAGGSVTVALAGFRRTTSVDVVLAGVVLGTVTTNSVGAARVSVRIPSSTAAGPVVIRAAGSGDSASVTLTVTR